MASHYLPFSPVQQGRWGGWGESAPSLVLSQKQLVAVCSPAPFFCMTTDVTAHVRTRRVRRVRRVRGTGGRWLAGWLHAPMYLNGLFRSLSFFMQPSITCAPEDEP